MRDKDNVPLPGVCALRFLTFEKLPDYSSGRPDDPAQFLSTGRDNQRYWREAAEYARVHLSMVELRFELSNRSDFALSNTKLEVSVEALDGQAVQLLVVGDLRKRPKAQDMNPIFGWDDRMPNIRMRSEDFVIVAGSATPLCHARFGTLLPGETTRAPESLGVRSTGPGKLRFRFRILAGELATPIESERLLEVTGPSEKLGLEGLQKVLAG